MFENLVELIEHYLGMGANDVTKEGMRAELVYRTPTEIPIFTISLWTGDGIKWQVGRATDHLFGMNPVLMKLHEM